MTTSVFGCLACCFSQHFFVDWEIFQIHLLIQVLFVSTANTFHWLFTRFSFRLASWFDRDKKPKTSPIFGMNQHRLTWSQTRPPELQNMYSVLSILLRIPDLKDQKLNGWNTKMLNFVVWPKDDILLTGSGGLLFYLIVSSDLKLLTFGFCDGISSVRWWTFGRRFIGNFLVVSWAASETRRKAKIQ